MGDVIEFKRDDEEDDLNMLGWVEWATLLGMIINELDEDEDALVTFSRFDDEDGHFVGYVPYLIDFDDPLAGCQFLSDENPAGELPQMFQDLSSLTDWLYERVDVNYVCIRGKI